MFDHVRSFIFFSFPILYNIYIYVRYYPIIPAHIQVTLTLRKPRQLHSFVYLLFLTWAWTSGILLRVDIKHVPRLTRISWHFVPVICEVSSPFPILSFPFLYSSFSFSLSSLMWILWSRCEASAWKNDKRKKNDNVWKNHLKGLGVFTNSQYNDSCAATHLWQTPHPWIWDIRSLRWLADVQCVAAAFRKEVEEVAFECVWWCVAASAQFMCKDFGHFWSFFPNSVS